MTPKEKAQELFDKMKGFRVKHSHSKKCATICVDMIIESLEMNSVYDEAQYWLNVKQHIQNL